MRFEQVSTLPDGRRLVLREAVPEDAEKTIAHVQKIVGESDYLMLEPGEFRPALGEQRQLLEDSPGRTTVLDRRSGRGVGRHASISAGKAEAQCPCRRIRHERPQKVLGDVDRKKIAPGLASMGPADREDPEDQPAGPCGQRAGHSPVPFGRLQGGGNHIEGILHRWPVLRRSLDGNRVGLNPV